MPRTPKFSLPDFATYRVRERVRGLGHNLLIAAAERSGIQIRVTAKDPAVFTFSKGRRTVTVTRLEFGLNSALAKTICQRKEVTRAFVQRRHLPVPRGVFLRLTEGGAPLAAARRLGFPLVLKPPNSSGGQLAYPNIQTVRELKEHLERYKDFGVREVVAERHVRGRNYRLLILDGRLIGLSERLAPAVVGDGRSTVRQLVERRNTFRRGNLPILCVILDRDARHALRRHGLRPSSVLRRGRAVVIHDVTNVTKGGTCRELLTLAHPQWKNVARRIGAAIPGARLLGADVIAQDIMKPPFDSAQGKRGQRWWIIEVNANPEIELHHFPWEGRPSDPASAIVRALFTPSS